MSLRLSNNGIRLISSGSSVTNINTGVPVTVDTTGYDISGLRALNPTTTNKVFYCNESGKEGFWEYDSSDTTSVDNLGTVLIAQNNKRLKRIINDLIEYSWFDQVNQTVAFDYCNEFAKLLNLPIELPVNEIINIDKSYSIGTNIRGNGTTIKLINNSSVTTNIFTISSNNVTITDLIIDGNRLNNPGTSTTGVLGIVANNRKYLTLDKVTVQNTRNIGIIITNCPYFIMRNSRVYSCGRFGQEMPSAQADRIGMLVDNNTAVIGDDNYMGSESLIEDSIITESGLDGLVLGAAITVNKVIAFNNGVEFQINDVGAAGIYVRPPQSVTNGIIDGLKLLNCVAYNNTGLGIDVGNNATSVLNPKVVNIIIDNCKTYNNNLHGIGVASCENCVISNNICYNNGVRATLNSSLPNPRRAGIGVDSIPSIPFKDILIQNNICYDTSSTQQNGIYIGSSPSNNYGSQNLTIINNDLTRNVGRSVQLSSSINPVQSTSILKIDNPGQSNFTLTPSSGAKVFCAAPHLYITGGTTITGIDYSTVGTIITIENVSSSTLTLVNSGSLANGTFSTLTGSNLLLSQNDVARFVFVFTTGQYFWKQIPNSQKDITNTNLVSYSKSATDKIIDSTVNITGAISIFDKRFDQTSTKVADLSNGDTNIPSYLKIANVFLDASQNFQDFNCTLAFESSTPSSAAIAHFYMRHNTSITGVEAETTILSMSPERGNSGQGTVFGSDSFIITNNGFGTPFFIYIKKYAQFGNITVSRITEKGSINSTIQYLSNQSWSTTPPTGTVLTTNSTHTINYSKSRSVISSNLSLVQNDYVVFANPNSDSSLNFTLPNASTYKDKIYTVKKNTTTGIVTLGNVDSSAYTLVAPNECVSIQSDGTNWRVLNSYGRTVYGKMILSSGTNSVTINGISSNSICVVTLSSNSGSAYGSTWNYRATCTTNTLSITAILSNGSTNVNDTSTINYAVTL